MKIRHHYDDETRKRLESRGVHRLDILGSKQTFDLRKNLCSFQVSNPVVSMSAERQMKGLQRMFANPLAAYSIVGISSWPNDLKAAQLAVALFESALSAWDNSKRRTNKSAPLWHRVYGGFSDTLIDGRANGIRPSFLVISNLTPEPTNYRMEKVRDLLEIHKGIPVVVVLPCANGPIDFFRNRLGYPIELAIHVGNASSSVNLGDI